MTAAIAALTGLVSGFAQDDHRSRHRVRRDCQVQVAHHAGEGGRILVRQQRDGALEDDGSDSNRVEVPRGLDQDDESLLRPDREQPGIKLHPPEI